MIHQKKKPKSEILSIIFFVIKFCTQKMSVYLLIYIIFSNTIYFNKAILSLGPLYPVFIFNDQKVTFHKKKKERRPILILKTAYFLILTPKNNTINLMSFSHFVDFITVLITMHPWHGTARFHTRCCSFFFFKLN